MPRRIGCAMRNAMQGGSGYPRRTLRARPADQSWRGKVEGTEAAPADVRDSHHRAVSAARELGRGGADRDVSSRGIGASGRGHHGGAVGTRVSPSTVSDLNKKIYATIEAWRNRPIEGEHPYVYLDGIVLKRSWAGEVRNVSLLGAIGVNESGYREILGICEGAKEDKTGWSAFLKHLKERGLKGVRLITSDACIGLTESAAEFFPEAAWQRCIVHWYRNIFSHVPSTKVREIAAMLKAIHAGEYGIGGNDVGPCYATTEYLMR